MRQQSKRQRFGNYKRWARQKQKVFRISFVTFCRLIALPCHYCGATESVGIDRIRPNTGYYNNNCVSCCSTCNYMKYRSPRAQFLEHVMRIAQHQFKNPMQLLSETMPWKV